MLYLVTGGSASGKSEYAERLTAALGGMPRYYIATMRADDEESRRRVARHRAMRSGKGFVTVERGTDLEGLRLDGGAGTEETSPRGTALLECMSNLVANEMYLPEGAGRETAAAVLRGIDALRGQVRDLVIVTNEVFSDGAEYDAFTEEYLRILGGINVAAAARADAVIEVVCSVPIIHKGAEYVQFT